VKFAHTKAAVLCILCIGILTTLLFLASSHLAKHVPGAIVLGRAYKCVISKSAEDSQPACRNPSDFTPINLPDLHISYEEAKNIIIHYRFVISLDELPPYLFAFYIPKYAEALSISVNKSNIANAIHRNGELQLNWNTPGIFTVPSALLRRGENQIDLILAGYPQNGVKLYPLQFGRAAAFEDTYERREWMTIGVGRMSLALMAATTLIFGFLSFAKGRSLYRWLTLSGIAASVYCAHFALRQPPVSYDLWIVIWHSSAKIYALSISIFFYRFEEIKAKIHEALYIIYVIFSCITLAYVPSHDFLQTSLYFHAGDLFFGIWFLINFFLHSHKNSRVKTITLMVMFCFMASIGISDYLLSVYSSSSISFLQFLPVVMTATASWLVFSQLAESISSHESLTNTLQARINEKTGELAASYAALAESQRLQAIDAERQRIMLDLHDGVGGQLVNTLAYLETADVSDPLLRSALEDALLDLGLMTDSLECVDSVTTLLGMLRGRLEPLLAAHGLRFIWQIEEEPETPGANPSRNINLLRIVQEAVTNAVKHAGADTITVRADRCSITITDNGLGLKKAGPNARGANGGHGLRGMHRRAQEVGARLAVEDLGTGTRVGLYWD
jgi:signal transduction histidine kinase